MEAHPEGAKAKAFTSKSLSSDDYTAMAEADEGGGQRLTLCGVFRSCVADESEDTATV